MGELRVKIRPAKAADLVPLWRGIFVDPRWKEFDAPYFDHESISLDQFEQGLFKSFSNGEDAQVIECDGVVVGGVTSFWENRKTRWLDIGITIYSPLDWGRGIGKRALAQWITHLFDQHEVARIGLVTWSGNPRMVASAQAIGFEIEGVIRKVRYHDGVYYDSIVMGILKQN